jgi:hypothetical protein
MRACIRLAVVRISSENAINCLTAVGNILSVSLVLQGLRFDSSVLLRLLLARPLSSVVSSIRFDLDFLLWIYLA